MGILRAIFKLFEPTNEDLERLYEVVEWDRSERDRYRAIVASGPYKNRIVPVFYVGKNSAGVITCVLAGDEETKEDVILSIDSIKFLGQSNS